MVNNADWLGPLSLFEFLRDVGKHFTVNQMVAKDSVKSRLERADQGISYTEFSYMLLQAYDFLHLFDTFGCRLQLGGSDQWGNITMGIELVRKVRQERSWGLTTPLVLKADGTKFGKTESGTVWLDADRTSPYQLYQFFLRSEDAVVGSYLRYFTFLSHEEILELDEATADHPERRGPSGSWPVRSARWSTATAETDRAEGAAAALFGEEVAEPRRAHAARRLRRCALHDALPRPGSTAGAALVDLLVDTGLDASKSRARTTVDRAAPTSTTAGRSDLGRRSAAGDWSPGGTWCSGRASGTTTWSRVD